MILSMSGTYHTEPYASLCWTSGGDPSPSQVERLLVTADRGVRTL